MDCDLRLLLESGSNHPLRRPTKQKHSSAKRSARPPITPPIIAPIGVDFGVVVGEGRLEVWEPAAAVAEVDDELAGEEDVIETEEEDGNIDDEDEEKVAVVLVLDESVDELLWATLSVEEELELGLGLRLGLAALIDVEVETTVEDEVITVNPVDTGVDCTTLFPVKTTATYPDSSFVVAMNVAKSVDPQPH